MPLFLSSLFTKFGAYALMALAALGAVAAVLAGARNAGRNAQIVADQKKALSDENQRKQVDLAIATGGDAERQRLRNQYSRD